ncbi:MAG: hypothetical protein ACOCYR_05430 [Erythrobacter sp.]
MRLILKPLLNSVLLAMLAGSVVGCMTPETALQAPASMSGVDCVETQTAPARGHYLCAAGARRSLIRAGDLSARIALADVPANPNMIAVGPVAGLQGEITIYEGEIFVSTIERGEQVRDAFVAQEASFLAFGAASGWREIDVPGELASLPEIESFVLEQARLAGIPVARPFPFRIEGVAAALDYHVIFKPDTKPHDRVEHQKAKVKFAAENETVRIAGVWADSAAIGRYTHPGQHIHLHAVLGEGERSGHIDAIRLKRGARLFLPG